MGLPQGDPHQIGRRRGRQPTAIELRQYIDPVLACSSAPHPSDPQPPNLTTKREKTDIPTLLSADAGLRNVIASTATVAVLPFAMQAAKIPPAMSICPSSHPPKISPY